MSNKQARAKHNQPQPAPMPVMPPQPKVLKITQITIDKEWQEPEGWALSELRMAEEKGGTVYYAVMVKIPVLEPAAETAPTE